MRAGVIGLGAMGAPMARNLQHAGLLAAVWNRTAVSARPFSEAGVPVAADPAALAAACDVILISVSRDADALEVVDRMLPGLTNNKVVVDTSTVAAHTAVEAARQVAQRGAEFLDAPVSGGVEGAHRASLAMMVGGDAAVLERVRAVLETVAAKVVHMGPVGAGQATKAVNQIMVAGINQAVSEALAFGELMDLPLDKVMEVVGGGAAANWLLAHRGPSMAAGNYQPGFKLALHHKDLSICQAMLAEQVEARLPVVEMTLVHYRRLMEAGFGDEDISALLREKRRLLKGESDE